MTETIKVKTKGKAKTRPKQAPPARTKEGRELVHSLWCRKLSHPKPLLYSGTIKVF
jgi:hypothetical protein